MFCTFCLNGNCKDGDKCTKAQAHEVFDAKNKTIPNVWEVEVYDDNDEQCDPVTVYHETKTSVDAKKAEYKKFEDEEKAKQLAKKTVRATGPTFAHIPPMSSVFRDFTTNANYIRTTLKEVVNNPNTAKDVLPLIKQRREAISNTLDLMYKREAELIEEMLRDLSSLPGDHQDFLNSLPTPKADE
jgi:hypothetical protein